MRMFGLKYAFVSTLDHDLHRMRRNAFSRYFSKASLQRLEPGIQSVLDLMLSRLENIRGTGKVINLLGLYTCLTGDIISQYAFAHPHGLLDDPDFSPHWYRIMMSITRNTHLLKQFGFLMPLVMATPEWLSKSTIPGMKMLIDLRKVRIIRVVLKQCKSAESCIGLPEPSNQSKERRCGRCVISSPISRHCSLSYCGVRLRVGSREQSSSSRTRCHMQEGRYTETCITCC